MSAHLLDCIEDAWESQVNIKHVCRNCGALSRNLAQGDGFCPKCNGADPDPLEDSPRQAESRRRGYLQTASLLRRSGFPLEAEWHEERARR